MSSSCGDLWHSPVPLPTPIHPFAASTELWASRNWCRAVGTQALGGSRLLQPFHASTRYSYKYHYGKTIGNQHLLLLSSSTDQNNPTPANGHKLPKLLIRTRSRTSSSFSSLPAAMVGQDPSTSTQGSLRNVPASGMQPGREHSPK